MNNRYEKMGLKPIFTLTDFHCSSIKIKYLFNKI